MVSLVLVFEVAVAVGLVVGVMTLRPGVLAAVGAAVIAVLAAAAYLRRGRRRVDLAETNDDGEKDDGAAAEASCVGTGVRVPLYSEQTYRSIVGQADGAHADRIRPTPGTRAPPLEQREAFIRAHRDSMGSRESTFYVRAVRDTAACTAPAATTERYYGSALEGEHAAAPLEEAGGAGGGSSAQ